VKSVGNITGTFVLRNCLSKTYINREVYLFPYKIYYLIKNKVSYCRLLLLCNFYWENKYVCVCVNFHGQFAAMFHQSISPTFSLHADCSC
jgi:hypothetical protein